MIAGALIILGFAVLIMDGINKQSIVSGPMLVYIGTAIYLHMSYWIYLSPLLAIGMVGICAPEHPLAAKEIWQAEDFAGETLITYPVPDDMLDLLRKILLPRGINPQRRHSELTIAIVQLVASRRGIAALPYWTVMPYLEKGYVVSRKITENGLQSELYAAMRSEDGDTGYLADFCQIVRDQGFATLPGLSILE